MGRESLKPLEVKQWVREDHCTRESGASHPYQQWMLPVINFFAKLDQKQYLILSVISLNTGVYIYYHVCSYLQCILLDWLFTFIYLSPLPQISSQGLLESSCRNSGKRSFLLSLPSFVLEYFCIICQKIIFVYIICALFYIQYLHTICLILMYISNIHA